MNAIRNNTAPFALSEPDLLELLRIMDASASNRGARDRRKHARHPHVSKDIHVKVVQPGGGTNERQVTVRDLSASGVQMLYPGYLHNGTSVQVELRKRLGGTELIQGEVKNCRHVHGAWHAVGIKFKEVIFPQLFLSQGAQNRLEAAPPAKVDVTRLKGSILLVDDQMMDRNLFTHLLKGSCLRVTEASSAEEAVALVVRSLSAEQDKGAQTASPFDLVVCDLNLGEVPGEKVIARIREAGYRGPILVMTAETVRERITAATAAGGTGVFQKPYSAEKLHWVIATQLGERCLIVDDPIYSPMCEDPQTRLMVEKYVGQVRSTAVELRKFISENNLTQVRVLCQSLKGTGVGYGFGLLTDVAAAAIVSLDASSSVAESITDLHRLDAICSRLSSAEPPEFARVRR